MATLMKIIPLLHPYAQSLRAALRRGLHDGSGTVAVIFAVAFVAILGVGGLAIDSANYWSAKEAGRRAADAAALAALSPTTAKSERAHKAKLVFQANLPSYLTESVKDFDIQITDDDGIETATVNFALEAHLLFGPLYSGAEAVARGKVAASVNRAPKIDVALWFDGSASMGVAATESARDQLRALSKNDFHHKNCAFACHLPTQQVKGVNSPSIARARANNVPLRIDAMRDAADHLIVALTSDEDNAKNVRFSFASFHSKFEQLKSWTKNKQEFRNEVAAFDLTSGAPGSGTTLGNRGAASRISETLATGATALLASPAPADTRRAVVIVTDGMQFDWHNFSPGPIDPSVCEPLKESDVIVAVIQTRYVALHGDGAFNTWVLPVYHLLGPALEACASPGFFLSADTPAQIDQAFKDLAVSLQASLRLTK